MNSSRPGKLGVYGVASNSEHINRHLELYRLRVLPFPEGRCVNYMKLKILLCTRHEKLKTSSGRMKTDGLNSLKYDIVKTEEHPLHTQITVNVDPNAV